MHFNSLKINSCLSPKEKLTTELDYELKILMELSLPFILCTILCYYISDGAVILVVLASAVHILKLERYRED